MMCTTVWGSLFAFCKYLSHTRRPFLTLQSPPNIIITSLFSGVWLTFPPKLRVFYLHGRVLLEIGLVSACGLATTLGIAVRCYTTIRLESAHCTLVACDVKYIHPLATTLNIAIRCNTTIRPESVHWALMTYGQMFVCCSATILGITVRCDTAIRPESIYYVLAVIRLLPICHAHFI